MMLFIFTVLSHISVLVMILLAKPWHYAVSLVVYFLMAGVGVGMTYHRFLAHKSFQTTRITEYIITLCATLAGVGSGIGWVAVHREHHRFSDKERDPHSPIHKRWHYIQFLTMFHNVNIKYAVDLMKDPLHVRFHTYYWHYHLAYIILLATLISPFAVVYAYLVPSFLTWTFGSLVNFVCHKWGYKHATGKDESKNNLMLGYLVWGEGWHSNHHNNPLNPNNQHKWWEFDAIYQIIRVIRK